MTAGLAGAAGAAGFGKLLTVGVAGVAGVGAAAGWTTGGAAGFAGATGDAFTLFERFEAKLKENGGNLVRASVEMAKDWRTDKYLRRLEAMLLVADTENLLILSGAGDVIEPDDGIAAIGSGGAYALAAARALCRHTDKGIETVVRESMHIAAEICVFTNDNLTLETLTE